MAKQTDLITGVKEIIQDTTFTSTRILDYLNQGQRYIAGGVFLTYPDRTQLGSSPLPDLVTKSDLETSVSNPYINLPSDFGRNLFFLYSSTNDLMIDIYGSYAELLRFYPGLDNTNRVMAAAVRGGRLYYQGYPSTAETLQAHYYRVPTDMTTYTASTISFAATGSRISDSASSSSVGFGLMSVGQTIDFTETTNNNTAFTITAIATDYSYITVTPTPTDESAGSSFTVKSRPLGIPVYLQELLLENYVAWQIFQRKTKNDVPMDVEAKRYHGLFLGAMLTLESTIESVPEPIQLMSARY